MSTGSVVLEQSQALRVNAAFPMQKRMSLLIQRMFKDMRSSGFSDDWRNFNPKVGGISTRRLAEFQSDDWRNFNPTIGPLQTVLKKIDASGSFLQRTRSSPHDGRCSASTAKTQNFFAGCFQYLTFYL